MATSTTSLQIVSSNISHSDNNCQPIIIDLAWNTNDKYDPSTMIPQCVHQSMPPWTDESNMTMDNEISINDKCIPLSHNEETVKCGCIEFGTYSTLATQSYSIYLDQAKQIHFDTISIIIASSLSIILLLLLHSECRIFCLGEENDEPLIGLEVYLSSKEKYRMWLLTREGGIHWGLRFKFEKATKYKEIQKLGYLWKHYIFNDGLLLPFCCRMRGSNYYTLQRVINLFWLIFFILCITMIITAYNKDINPSFCTEIYKKSDDGFVGSELFCIRKYEIPVTLIMVLILCIWHFLNREFIQLIHPNKLRMDLEALLSASLYIDAHKLNY